MIDSPDSVPLAYMHVLQLIDTVYLLYSRTSVNLYNVPTQNLQRNLQFPAPLLQVHPIFTQLIEPTLYAHVITHNDHADPNEDGHHLKAISTFHAAIRQPSDPELPSQPLSWTFSAIRGRKWLMALKLERIQLTFTVRNGFADWQWLPIAFRTAFVALPRQNRQHSFKFFCGLKISDSLPKGCSVVQHIIQFSSSGGPRTPIGKWMTLLMASPGYYETNASGLRSLTLKTSWKRLRLYACSCRTSSPFVPHLWST